MVPPPWVEMILTLAGWLQGSSHMNHILAASDNAEKEFAFDWRGENSDRPSAFPRTRKVRVIADPNGRVREMSWNLGGKP
jgi:hypothetical protein